MTRVLYGGFEWDDTKARANLANHGVSFQEAVTVFSDPNAIDAPDRFIPGRFVIVGLSNRVRVLFVVYAERADRIRSISARKASAMQRRIYEEGIA